MNVVRKGARIPIAAVSMDGKKSTEGTLCYSACSFVVEDDLLFIRGIGLRMGSPQRRQASDIVVVRFCCCSSRRFCRFFGTSRRHVTITQGYSAFCLKDMQFVYNTATKAIIWHMKWILLVSQVTGHRKVQYTVPELSNRPMKMQQRFPPFLHSPFVVHAVRLILLIVRVCYSLLT